MVRTLFVAALGASLSVPALAGVNKSLPLPSGTPSADDVANQVYFVNHFFSLDNYSIQKKGRQITTILNKSKGSKPLTITVERYLNNSYDDGVINSKDLAIFRNGKLRGTGMLITDYVDDSKSQDYSIWLPALRKIRRFAEPAHDDAWGGTDFTFGDVTLRKPKHETHELLGTVKFSGCLGAIKLADNEHTRWTKNLPEPACHTDGKEVYKLKSTTKFNNWWYDYRISYVDTKTFADYRTEFFKGGNQIKVIDRDWQSLGLEDPRAQSWGYWYGKTLASGHETWAIIPDKVVGVNDGKLKDKLWSEQTLRKIKK